MPIDRTPIHLRNQKPRMAENQRMAEAVFYSNRILPKKKTEQPEPEKPETDSVDVEVDDDTIEIMQDEK